MSQMRTVCRISDLAESTPALVQVDGEDIVLVRQGQEVYALSDLCSHAEVSLSTGDVADGAIECWLHGSRFDLRTGEPSGPPAWEPVQIYQTTVGEDGAVAVSLGR
jgi:3-phenylpropionate/trans-cinnamate dioxygenase ferredoxin subunit